MPDLGNYRTVLGHAVADVIQEQIAAAADHRAPDGGAAIDPRLIAATAWEVAGRDLRVQRALVAWARGVAVYATEEGR